MFQIVFFDELGWSSLQNGSAYWVFLWVEFAEEFWEWCLVYVAYCDALADVDVAEGVDVDSALVGKVFV
jgi:hypothetical protein